MLVSIMPIVVAAAIMVGVVLIAALWALVSVTREFDRDDE